MAGPEECAGAMLGEIWFQDYDVPPVGQWTTQCVALQQPQRFDHVAVAALSDGATDTAVASIVALLLIVSSPLALVVESL